MKTTCRRCGNKFEIIQPVRNLAIGGDDEKVSVEIVSFVFRCPTPGCAKKYNWQNETEKSLQKIVKSSKV